MESSSEIWRPIVGNWRRCYEVSSLGRVRTTDTREPPGRGRTVHPGFRKLTKDRDGYWRVGLSVDDTRRKSMRKVARLVALAFLPPAVPNMEVDHINGDPGDDRVENLEWVTAAEQQRRRAARMRAAGKLSSMFIGVSWHAKDRRWIAQVWVAKRRITIGRFVEEIKAARAYDTYVSSQNLDNPLNWSGELKA